MPRKKWNREPQLTKAEVRKKREFLILMGADGSDEVDQYYLSSMAKSFTINGPFVRPKKLDNERIGPLTYPAGYPDLDPFALPLKSLIGKGR